jgi:hypothetical protein
MISANDNLNEAEKGTQHSHKSQAEGQTEQHCQAEQHCNL